MARPSLPGLSPEQVVKLYDALLANADPLLTAAATLNASGRSAWPLQQPIASRYTKANCSR